MKRFFRDHREPIAFVTLAIVCLAIIFGSFFKDGPSPYMQQQVPKPGYETYTRVEAADGCVWRIWLSENRNRSENEVELRPDGSRNCKR